MVRLLAQQMENSLGNMMVRMLAQQMENLLVQKTDPTKVIIEKLQVQTTKKEISKISLSRWFEILTFVSNNILY